MVAHWTDLFSFVGGAVRSRELTYLALVNDEMAATKTDHSYFSQWYKGVWGKVIDGSSAWTTCDVTVCQHPLHQCIFLGLNGEVLCVGSGDLHEETIREGKPDSPENRGMMRGLATIDGKAYAVGMQRQVYRRDGANTWTCIDALARPAQRDETVYSFEGIGGFSAKEIYAAGRRGEIWRYDGTAWTQQDSPTNVILTRVCCAGDGNVYICGRAGTLIRGQRDRWDVIDHFATKDDFWGISWYNDHLYVSTMNDVYRLEGDKLMRLDFGEDKPSSFLTLSAADGVLWSIGPKDVMSFDGKAWTRID